jgi:hypothetical protein
MFEEHKLHPLAAVRPQFAVVRWIEVQERAGFRRDPAFEGTAAHCGDSLLCGCGGAICIQFNGSEGKNTACTPYGLRAIRETARSAESGSISYRRIAKRKLPRWCQINTSTALRGREVSYVVQASQSSSICDSRHIRL